MLRVHTIFKNNLARDALNYNWTDHAVNTIKEIIKVGNAVVTVTTFC